MELKKAMELLYTYYIENVCETYFSYDNNRYATLQDSFRETVTEEEKAKLFETVTVTSMEGTDAEWLKITTTLNPYVFLSVTSLIDYDFNRAKEYFGDDQWGDTGIFFDNNGNEIDF